MRILAIRYIKRLSKPSFHQQPFIRTRFIKSSSQPRLTNKIALGEQESAILMQSNTLAWNESQTYCTITQDLMYTYGIDQCSIEGESI